MIKRVKALEKELKKLELIISRKDKEIIKLQTAADYDFLTGLYNRRGFIMEAEKFINDVKNGNNKHKLKRRLKIRNFSIIFIDLDDLKKINDIYGHKIGDRFIEVSADIFKNSLRGLDIVSRWGGDEFVIGLVDANEDEALKIANKIKNKLGKAKISRIKKDHKFTASFGVISAKSKRRGKDIFNLYELIEKADMAMYDTKKNKGKNFIVLLNK
jgi:diguanylate cyclase (GGDEF)-like protein